MQNNFNPMYGGNMYPNMNMQYAQPRPQPKMVQTLTKEQIAQLRNNGGTFNIQLTQEDIWKGICTHKDNGAIVLIDNGDGTVTCPICGETFNLSKSTDAEVQAAVDTCLDCLQSAKTMYLNIPEQMAAQYFQMIPLLKKLPQLYKIAAADFARYDTTLNNAQMQYQNNTGFNALGNLISPMAGMPMMGGMNMANGYMGMPNVPMGNMGGGMPTMPMNGVNPFGNYAGQPMPQYPNMMAGQMPQMQQPYMQPNMMAGQMPQQGAAPQQAPVPTAPAVGETVTQQKVMNV